jgi:tRNA G26 N,N-dimethylase Trm1
VCPCSYNRIRGLLNMVLEELPDAPLYYNLHDVCKTVKATAMKADIFRWAAEAGAAEAEAGHCPHSAACCAMGQGSAVAVLCVHMSA